jgi:hypothetical protein
MICDREVKSAAAVVLVVEEVELSGGGVGVDFPVCWDGFWAKELF